MKNSKASYLCRFYSVIAFVIKKKKKKCTVIRAQMSYVEYTINLRIGRELASRNPKYHCSQRLTTD